MFFFHVNLDLFEITEWSPGLKHDSRDVTIKLE